MTKSVQVDNRQHYLIAIVLGLAGLLIILLFVTFRSQGDDTTSTVSISNTAPTVSITGIRATDGLCNNYTSSQYGSGRGTSAVSTTEKGSTTVCILGTYTDVNGCGQVAMAASGTSHLVLNYNGGFLDMAALGNPSMATSTDCLGVSSGFGGDERNCYNKNMLGLSYTCNMNVVLGEGGSYAGCGTADPADTTGAFICSVSTTHVAFPGDADTSATGTWSAHMAVYDGTDYTSTTHTSGFDMATTTALDVTGSMNFGSVAVDADSSERVISVTNTGNNYLMQVRLSGLQTSMGCTTGTISTTTIKFATTSAGVSYATKNRLDNYAHYNLASNTIRLGSLYTGNRGSGLDTAYASSTGFTNAVADGLYSTLNNRGSGASSTFWTIRATPLAGSGNAALAGSCTTTLTYTGASS